MYQVTPDLADDQSPGPHTISKSILEEDGYYLTVIVDVPVCTADTIKISQAQHIE